MRLVRKLALPNLKSRLKRMVACVFALVLCACHGSAPSTLADWRHGELVVLEAAQQQDSDSQFNHQLAVWFAQYLHLKLKVIEVDPADVMSALTEHRAHLAAFSLRSNEATLGLIFAPSFMMVQEHVLVSNEAVVPHALADLKALPIVVIEGSAQHKILQQLKLREPNLTWQTRRSGSVEDLLDALANHGLSATLANQEQFALAKNYDDNLIASDFALIAPSQLAWGFASDSDAQLRRLAEQFFAAIKADGRLNNLLDRYYGFNDRLSPVDAATFIAQIDTQLPLYQKLFAEAAHSTGLDWQLIAALAYQESHWNPLATSYTNVRGMMMLTEETADQLKVANRLDARDSILAGARYLAGLRDRLPARVAEPDRTWMALAAYNQGFGHLEDARVLTQRMGMNENRWADVKRWMPKLTQSVHHQQLKHGYARGGEAVILVENIRMYDDILRRIAPEMRDEQLPATPFYQLLDSGNKARLKGR
jgi:membrane-bound lytic murein transglycosylase F